MSSPLVFFVAIFLLGTQVAAKSSKAVEAEKLVIKREEVKDELAKAEADVLKVKEKKDELKDELKKAEGNAKDNIKDKIADVGKDLDKAVDAFKKIAEEKAGLTKSIKKLKKKALNDCIKFDPNAEAVIYYPTAVDESGAHSDLCGDFGDDRISGIVTFGKPAAEICAEGGQRERVRYCSMPVEIGNKMARNNGKDSARDLGGKLSQLTPEDGLTTLLFVGHCVLCPEE